MVNMNQHQQQQQQQQQQKRQWMHRLTSTNKTKNTNTNNTNNGVVTAETITRPRCNTKSSSIYHHQHHRTRGNKAMSTSESSLFSYGAVSSVAPSVCSVSTYGSSDVTSVASSVLNSPTRPVRKCMTHIAVPHAGIPASIIETTISTSNTIAEEPQLQLPPIRFTQTYELSHSIGSNKGAFSTVWLGSNRHTGESVAVKMIRRDALTPNEDKAVFNEVSILHKLQEMKGTHSSSSVVDLLEDNGNVSGSGSGGGVLQLIDFFATAHTFYIVTEYVDGGDMMDMLEKCGRFLEEEVQSMIYSLVKTMHFMHQNGVAHRDLKPENLLLGTSRNTSANTNNSGCGGSGADSHLLQQQHRDSNRRRNTFSQVQVLKVADFGLAANVDRPRSLSDRCGTPMYVAPEVLRGLPYDQTCDMWSLGVIVYYLLSGCPPFYDRRSKQGLYKKILRGTVVLDGDGWDAISPEAKHFISSCLCVNPRGRMNSMEALRHPWLHGFNNQ
jgi:serine/threonine protein kinase